MGSVTSRLARLTEQVWPLLLMALLLRLAAVLFIDAVPYSDAQGYWDRGVQLALHGTYEDAYHPMGMSIFIALVVGILGTSVKAVAMVQALLSTAMVWLVYDLGCRTVGRKAAWVAALLLAFHGAHIFFTTLMMTEVVFSFLVLAAAWALATWTGWRRVLVAGIALGLAAHIRPFILYIVIFLLPFLIIVPRWRRQILLLAGVAAIMLLTLSPRLIQTWRQYGQPLLGTNSGINLLYANNPKANGGLNGAPWARQWLAENHPESEQNPLLRSRQAKAQAIDWIRHHPVAFVKKGMRAAWTILDLERNIAFYYWHDALPSLSLTGFRSLRNIFAAAWPLILFLSLPGLLRMRTLRDMDVFWLGIILFFLALHFVGFGQARFRLPLTAFFTLFAGRAWVQEGGWRDLLKGRGGSHRLSWAMAILTAAVFTVGWLKSTL